MINAGGKMMPMTQEGKSRTINLECSCQPCKFCFILEVFTACSYCCLLLNFRFEWTCDKTHIITKWCNQSDILLSVSNSQIDKILLFWIKRNDFSMRQRRDEVRWNSLWFQQALPPPKKEPKKREKESLASWLRLKTGLGVVLQLSFLLASDKMSP